MGIENKRLGVSVKVDLAEVKKELGQLKSTIDATFKNLPQSVKALTDSFKQQIDTIKQVNQSMQSLTGSLDNVTNSTRKVRQAKDEYHNALLNLRGGIRGYIQDIERMIAIQLRWYGARQVLFLAAELPVKAVKSGIEYTVLLDDWNAKLLRWGATSGQVTASMRSDIQNLINDIRKVSIFSPSSTETTATALEGFIGAGVPTDIVKNLAKDAATLKTAFPEINMEQFGVAITGVYNVFKDEIKGAKDEADKFRIIIEQLLKAQAEGIIRPEQFTKVAQYLGEVGHIAGLTTEQIFAMATVISDTGVRAASASRLIASFMLRLGNQDVQNTLAKIGIQLDKNKTIAEQLDKIFVGLKEKLGVGGQTSLGAITALEKISGKDAAKAMLPLIERWQSFVDLTERIKGSKGSLGVLEELNTSTISGQWKMLKNVMNELASSSIITGNNLKDIVVGLLDMARGALYALNPMFATAENVKKLGDAGKTTYEVVRDLATILGSLWDTIKPLISTLGSLTKAVLECHDAVILFTNILLARLAVGALGSVIGGITAVTGGVSALGASLKILRDLNVVQWVGQLTNGLSGLVTFLGGPWVITIGAAITVLTTFLSKLKELEQINNTQFIGPLNAASFKSVKQVDSFIEGMKQQRDSLSKKLEADKKNSLWLMPSNETTITRDLNETNRIISEAMIVRANLLKGKRESKPTKTTVDIPDLSNKDKTKASSGKPAMRELNAELEILKSELSLQQNQYENFYKLNLVDEDAYVKMKIFNAKEIEALELKEIEETRQRIAIEESDEKKRQAMYEQLNAKEIKIKNDTQKTINNLETEAELKHRERANKRLQFDNAMYTAEARQLLTAAQWDLNERAKQAQWLYGKGGMSSGNYYGAEITDAATARDLKKQYAEDEFNAWLRMQSEKESHAMEGSEQQRELWEETQKKHREMLDSQADADREYASNVRDTYRKMADDIKSVYDRLGARGVVGKSLRELHEDYSNEGKNIEEATKNMAYEMENALEEFFDSTSDNFLDLETLAKSVLNEIYKELIKLTVIQPIMSGLTSAFGSLFGSTGAASAGSSAGATVASFFGSAKGNVIYSPALSKLENSIVSSPVFFPMAKGAAIEAVGAVGEGTRPEAVLPLARTSSNDLGVQLVGQYGNSYSISVPVNINGEGVSTKISGKLQREIEKTVDRVLRSAS